MERSRDAGQVPDPPSGKSSSPMSYGAAMR
jgi:hypothetical protein